MRINRKLAATAIPLLVVASMGAKGGCSNSSSNSSSTSQPQPTTKVTTIAPSPLPTPLALGDGIPIKGVPAPQTDANPIPRFPPNKCASVAFPADTGLRIEGKLLVGRVRASCVAPGPRAHLTELQIWKVDGFEVLPIPGAYREFGQIPDIPPDYSTFKMSIPCAPGTYSFEYYVTWFDPDGTSGGNVGGGAQNAVVNPGDC